MTEAGGGGLAAALRTMIFDGRLPAGERINEVRLAQELGVSRTPLREALNRLATEGSLTSTARFGYFAGIDHVDEAVPKQHLAKLMAPTGGGGRRGSGPVFFGEVNVAVPETGYDHQPAAVDYPGLRRNSD